MPKSRKESLAELGKMLKEGTRVSVITPTLNLEGMICVGYDNKRVGKPVGVEVDKFHPSLHECDGACANGYGIWATPEELHVLD